MRGGIEWTQHGSFDIGRFEREDGTAAAGFGMGI